MKQVSTTVGGLRLGRAPGAIAAFAMTTGLLFVACKDDGTDAPSGGARGGTAGNAGKAGGGSGNRGGKGGAAGDAAAPSAAGASGEGGNGASDSGTGGTAGGRGGAGGAGGAAGSGHSGTGGEVAGEGGSGGESGSAGETGSGFAQVTALATGSQFSCALLANGSVKCWGDDSFGTLGDGPPAVSRIVTATDVLDLGKVKKIAAAGSTVCAIRQADDAVRCWGLNAYHALDVDASIQAVTAPVALKGFGDDVAIDVSVSTDSNRVTSHGCVIDDAHTIGCWGHNASYELGTTAADTNPEVVRVQDLGEYLAVVGGEAFSCGLTTDHGVKCWGNSAYGVLGNDMPTAGATAVPVDVVGLDSGVQQIAGSMRTACALTTSGGVKCWGSPAYGAVGASADLSQYNGVVPTPVDVAGLGSGVAAISGGTMSFCALMADEGSIYCWGYNQNGQLGNQPDPITINEFEPTPVKVVGITGATVVSIGWSHACAALAGGGVKCWGSGTPSGSDFTTNQIVPTYVRGL